MIRSNSIPLLRGSQVFGKCAIVCATSLMGMASFTAQAGVTDVALFRSSLYLQTGSTTVVPFNSGTNYFFTGLADVSSSSDYDVNGLTLTVPTSPTTVYTMTGPTGSSPFINYATQSAFLTKSALDTTYPLGDYVVDATNTGTGATAEVTLNYDGADFYSAAPTLTAATYNGLSGLNPNQPYTFAFDPFVPTGGNFAHVFLDIFDVATSTTVFSESGLDSLTSFVVPAGTFTPNTSYIEELDFSTRDEISDPPCVGSDPSQCPGLGELAWESATETDFTTGAAVPEASTWAMMLLGFAGLGFVGRHLGRWDVASRA